MDNKKESTEHHEPKEENLVQDLKKSIEDTLNETHYILDDLKETVETTIKDQSISDTTIACIINLPFIILVSIF